MMRIKEVEQRTGLTAKAIRLYESKGLLRPARQTENDYRDYTEEDLARLKTIAILRKLDVPVKTIKEWTDGERSLRDILQKAADQNREASRESELRCDLAKGLAQALKKDPQADLEEVVRDQEELYPLLQELAEAIEEDRKHVAFPLYSTLIGLGPICSTVLYILNGMAEKALVAFALSVGVVIWNTIVWRDYLTIPKEERSSVGCLGMVLGFVVLLVLAFGAIIWIGTIQEERYILSQMDVLLCRAQMLPLVFVAELVAGFFFVKGKPWKETQWRVRTVAIVATVLAMVNVLVFQVCVSSVSVAREEGITRYSLFCPEGELIPYTQIERVDAGFRGKTLGLPIGDIGEFYYKITYADGRTENWAEASCPEEEVTWSYTIWFDEWVLSGGAEKHGTDKNWEYCEMDQIYVDILREAINNR